ncbi:MAG TPA: response regulator transcription factor, partial [Vicinamibacterales bacterium]|nr:response regulator transcription factor [Vicinamibacterales bacterium]
GARRVTGAITVLLVDDHILVRRGFRRLLEDDSAIKVVGEASNRDEAVALNARLAPQVVVMDYAMPGINGLAAMREIIAASPGVAVLILSMHAEETLVRRALEAGARGYILKSALDLDLATAVRRVAAGEAVLDPNLTLTSTPPLEGERTRELSPREREVLQLICEGLSNREIGARLSLSVNTITVHRANIMTALGVHKAAELVVYAIQHGLVDLK